jgi:hypothetical protein
MDLHGKFAGPSERLTLFVRELVGGYLDPTGCMAAAVGWGEMVKTLQAKRL